MNMSTILGPIEVLMKAAGQLCTYFLEIANFVFSKTKVIHHVRSLAIDDIFIRC